MSIAAYAIDARITYVDKDGNPTAGAIGVLNPVKLVINTPEPERDVQISNKRDSFGQALDELVVQKPTEVEFGTDDADDAEVLSWAFNGEPSGYSQSSATISSGSPESHTAHLGQWFQLANRAVSSVVIKDHTDITTYTAGTDYLLDAVSGQVLPLKSGSIVDAATVHCSYSAAALTGQTIGVGLRSAIYVRIDGEGKNLVTGAPVHILARRCSLSASGAKDLVGGKRIVSEMKGKAFVVGSNPPVEITLLDS